MQTNYDWTILRERMERIAPHVSGPTALSEALGIPRSTVQDAIRRYGWKFQYWVELENPGISKCDRHIDRLALLGDTHPPFHDQRAIDLACLLVEDFAPDEVVHLGDGNDFYAVSSFDRDPNRVLLLQIELDQGFDINNKLNSAAPEAEWYYIMGNHGFRWMRFLSKNPEIYNLRALRLENLLRFNELGWTLVDTSRTYANDTVECTHGDRVSKHSGWSVKKLMEDRFFQTNIFCGHSHRTGQYIARGPREQVVGFEVGCLCRLDPTYLSHANWHQSVAFVTFNSEDDFFVEQVVFSDRRGKKSAIFRGKEYIV